MPTMKTPSCAQDLMMSAEEEGQALICEEILSGKLRTGDTFPGDLSTKILCVMIGAGVQVAGMHAMIILSSALGLSSASSSKGLVLTGMVIAFTFFAVASGYICVWLWKCINGSSDGWSLISWWASCGFSGVSIAISTVLCFIEYLINGSSEISLSLYFVVIAIWILVFVPLTRFGGLMAARSSRPTSFPMWIRHNHGGSSRREVWSWFLVLVAGLLPSAAIAFEVYFSFLNIIFGTFPETFAFMSILYLAVVISCAIVSVGLTYQCLVTEDPMWWWKAFCASGFTGLYMFVLMGKYIITDLGVTRPILVLISLGFAMILCIFISLFTGTVGFLSGFGFLKILSFLKNAGYPISVYAKNFETEMHVRSAGSGV